jgi:hypothetical protein
MTTTPRGADDLVAGQAIPETTVNENMRHVEAGACHFPVVDKDLTAPPGSCADGANYIIAATATGLWAGHETHIATALGTNAANGWRFHTPVEGFTAYLQDENAHYLFGGASWAVDNSAIPTEASAAEIWAGSSTTKFVSPDKLFDAAAPQALTSGTTVTPDFGAGNNFSLTLAHNATLANPSNPKVGQSGVIEITQDGTGGRTMGYGANWKFPGGAPVLSTAAGAIDVLAYYVAASNRILAVLTKAYTA